jgi:hypothetical protein
MAILKAGTYVFKAVPALANSLVQSEFTYKTYDLTNNDIYTTEPRTYLFMGSNMQSSDTKNIAIVKMTNSPGATEWSEKHMKQREGGTDSTIMVILILSQIGLQQPIRQNFVQ